jgi:hypothetical protein
LLVVALFVLGAYLIEDQFTNPLASQSLGLFAAAVLLASAMAMLYELIQLPSSLWGREALAPKRPQSTLAGVAPPGRAGRLRRDTSEPSSCTNGASHGLCISTMLRGPRSRAGVIAIRREV